MRRVRAVLSSAILLASTVVSARGQAPSSLVATDPPFFEFHSGFWLNLHHFLYTLARARLGLDSGRHNVSLVRADTMGLDALSPSLRLPFNDALAYYERHLARLDVFDRRMLAIKTRLGDLEDSISLNTDALPDSLAPVLDSAAPAYRAVWWPRHDAANRAWAAAIMPLLTRHGPALAQAVTSAFRERWSPFLIRVDLSAYASWAGAYTSLYPDRITVSTLDPDYRDDSALEMLFHESLHTYSDSLALALANAAAKVPVSLPRDLLHAMIFYTAGALTKRELGPSYVPYAFRLGIWSRGHFPEYLPLLEDEWQPYLDGQRSFDVAIAAIVRRLPASHGDATLLRDTSVAGDDRKRQCVDCGMLIFPAAALFLAAPSMYVSFGDSSPPPPARTEFGARHLSFYLTGGPVASQNPDLGWTYSENIELLAHGLYADGRLEQFYLLPQHLGYESGHIGFIIPSTHRLSGGLAVGYRGVRGPSIVGRQEGVEIALPLVWSTGDRWWRFESYYVASSHGTNWNYRVQGEWPIRRTRYVAGVKAETMSLPIRDRSDVAWVTLTAVIGVHR